MTASQEPATAPGTSDEMTMGKFYAGNTWALHKRWCRQQQERASGA